MSESKHTPGPWKVTYDRVFDRYQLRSKNGSFGHFHGWSSDGVTTEDEDRDNSRLIASAPELAEALKVALATIERLEVKHAGGFSSVTGTLDVARAALQKAGVTL